ncbi:MAG: DoxX family protein [Patescibacteria group bacterium]
MKKIEGALFALRVSLGVIFFYAGISKIMNPAWSAAGYLSNAATFKGFYHWLVSPGVLPTINFINEWSLFLLGVALILGIFVRLSSWLGVVLMALYYFPVLSFPYVGKNYFLVDEHVVFIVCLILLASSRAGRIWGLDKIIAKSSFGKRRPKLQSALG